MDLNALFSSPEGLGLLMTALMGGAKTMQGNQQALSSQEAIMGGGMGNPSGQGTGQALTQMATHPGMVNSTGAQMGAASMGNSLVNSGATLTGQQSRVAGPQMAQQWNQQGAVAPGLMQNIVGSLGGGMAMGNMASKMFRG